MKINSSNLNIEIDLQRICYFYPNERKLLLKTTECQDLTITYENEMYDFIKNILDNHKNIKYIKFKA